MKDRIKFNDAMLAAVMDGRKTQTRRPMKVQPVLNGNWWEVYGAGWGKDSKSMPAVPGHSLANNCPYGKVGEIISVADKDGNIKGKIEITDVWLQQIQEISPSDAIAEGIKAGRYGNEGNWLVGFYIPNSNQPYITEKNAFKELWSSIYGISSWRNNEWVWVIEFRKID
ncbi:TPA: ASCH domain-containing protein [Providencia stuartii]|uniref:ASCH domain-containing protein n=1 Tax=Providencia sp. PROV089 TaxID=2949805 RepID=UPI002349D09C|nr:ASCH domain-containing protein [Providencia sp. PROV089]HEM8865373.1 ASCH domain-containing protein [Providencia stuartii]